MGCFTVFPLHWIFTSFTDNRPFAKGRHWSPRFIHSSCAPSASSVEHGDVLVVHLSLFAAFRSSAFDRVVSSLLDTGPAVVWFPCSTGCPPPFLVHKFWIPAALLQFYVSLLLCLTDLSWWRHTSFFTWLYLPRRIYLHHASLWTMFRKHCWMHSPENISSDIGRQPLIY